MGSMMIAIIQEVSLVIQFALLIGAWGVRRIVLQHLLRKLLDILLTSFEI